MAVLLDTAMAERLINRDFPFDLVAQKQEISRVGNLKSELATPLRRLDVAFNALTNLWGLEQLPNLRVLSAYCNTIADLSGLQGVSRLESLRLQQNAIVELVDSFTSMRKLKELRLDHNNLSRVESYLSSCSSLQSLNLGSNRLVTVEGFAGLQSLQELRLPNNLIRSLLPLRALPHLKELDVSYNKLASLEGLQNLNALEILHAEYNHIKSVQISQTYSRGNKALTPATGSAGGGLSSSAAAAAAAFKKAAANPPTPASADIILGMTQLTDVFLRGNKLSSLEGLHTLGVALEILDVRDNEVSPAVTLRELTFCKRLRELYLEGNPCRDTSNPSSISFCNKLSEMLSQQCTLIKVFDDHKFVRTKDLGAKRVAQKKSFKTWDDAASLTSTVLVEGDVCSTIATTEAGDDGEEEEYEDIVDSGDEKDDEDDGDDGYDFNLHNVGLNAPTLSLKHMKTPEEIAQMELGFKSLMASCKDTLFTILTRPDEPLVISKPVAPQPATKAPQYSSQKQERDESVEEAASLFHHSSLETVAGFKNAVDHRGSLAKGSKLTDDGLPATQGSTSHQHKPTPPAPAFQVQSKVFVFENVPGIASENLSLAESSTNSVGGGNSINSSSSGGKARSPLTESRRLQSTTNSKNSTALLLGSGLTRHGTKIKQKGQHHLVDPLVAEFLEARGSQKSLLDFSVEEFPVGPPETHFRESESDSLENIDHHPFSAAGVRNGDAAFLTSAPSEATLSHAGGSQGSAAPAAADSYSYYDDGEYPSPSSVSGFGRFRSAAPAGKLSLAGIDPRFKGGITSSHSARSLPDDLDPNAGDDAITQIIETIKYQRRYSEPALLAAAVADAGGQQNREFRDDLEDDDDPDSDHDLDLASTTSVGSIMSLGSRPSLAAAKGPKGLSSGAVLKSFRKPTSLALSDLEAKLLVKPN